MHTLLLNADAKPVSYLPLSTITWQDAIRYMISNKGRVIEWYEDWTVHSERWHTRVPSVIMLCQFQQRRVTPRLNQRSVFLRDELRCQYCGTLCTEHTATLDHVIPVSQGGTNTWTNLTTACKTCNTLKGSSTQWKPQVAPYCPSYWELSEKRKRRNYRLRHHSWTNYIE